MSSLGKETDYRGDHATGNGVCARVFPDVIEIVTANQ